MIYEGDVLEQLRLMPENHYHCVVTSPPYWGMRDYGFDGQIGLEKVFDCTIVPAIVDNKIVLCGACFMCKLRAVFEEVRRVLRPDGVLWLNMGDNVVHHTIPGGDGPLKTKYAREHDSAPYRAVVVDGLKRKDVVGQPWRLAMCLQAMGWWLRRPVVWSKTNGNSSSARDIPKPSYEHIFLLSKSEKYYYDWAAIAKPMKESTIDKIMKIDLENKFSRSWCLSNIGDVWEIPVGDFNGTYILDSLGI